MAADNGNEEVQPKRHDDEPQGMLEEEQQQQKEEEEEEEELVNVLSAAEGARVLFATDEWFAIADNLLNDAPPTFDSAAYCEQGKVMDGWETRRRREAGHDWCVVKLCTRAALSTVTVDTAHFTGNHVPAISLQATDLSTVQEVAIASQFPNIVPRLLYGGIRGTGATPAQVAAAETACAAATWTPLLFRTPLQPGYAETRFHQFPLCHPTTSFVATHVRIHCFPDGGIARMRVYGTPTPPSTTGVAAVAAPWPYQPMATGPTCTVVPHTSNGGGGGDGSRPPPLDADRYPQVSGVDQGGVGVTCSNQHYGTPSNLIQASEGVDMGDGWETARHPHRPGVVVQNSQGLVDSDLSDWCVLKLGRPCTAVQRIVLDTKHFRGNYPESVQVEGCYCCHNEESDVALWSTSSSSPESASAATAATTTVPEWFVLIARGRLAPDAEHYYDVDRDQIRNAQRPVSHVRIRIYPDGGLSRVRIYGAPIESSSSSSSS